MKPKAYLSIKRHIYLRQKTNRKKIINPTDSKIPEQKNITNKRRNSERFISVRQRLSVARLATENGKRKVGNGKITVVKGGGLIGR